MIKRLISILIALVAAVLGYLAAFSGGVDMANSFGSLRGQFDPSSLLLLLLGVLLLAVSALTVVVTSAGVIMLGAVHLLFSIALIAFPPSGMFEDSVLPAYEIVQAVRGVSRVAADGLYFSAGTGFGLLAGVVLLGIGLVARSRRGVPSLAARLITGLIGPVVGVAGVVLVLIGGGLAYTRIMVVFKPVPTTAAVALVAGLVLVGIVVVLSRASSAGVIVLGGIVTILGVLFLFVGMQLVMPVQALSQDLGAGIQFAGTTGQVLIVGVLLLAAGFGARIRARRAVVREVPDVVGVPTAASV